MILIEEEDCIFDKWKDHELLENYNDKQGKFVATLLENQDLLAHQFKSDSKYKHLPDSLYEDALEIISKIYLDFVPFSMVQMSPMLGPIQILEYETKKYFQNLGIFYDGLDSEHDDKHGTWRNIIERQECSAKTRKLPIFIDSLNYINTNSIAKQFRDHITREIFTDLRNNVGTIGEQVISTSVLTREDIYNKIYNISGCIFRKTMQEGVNWIVSSPEIIKIFTGCEDEELNEIKIIPSTNCSWKIIVDPLFPKNQILCGTSPKHGGYFYNPYIPLAISQLADTKGYGIMTRYSKFLVKNCKCYGLIQFIQENAIQFAK